MSDRLKKHWIPIKVITYERLSLSTVKSSLLYFTLFYLLNLSNTVSLSLLPTHFQVDFLQLKPSQRLKLSSTAILRTEESGCSREMAVWEVTFRGRGSTVYSVHSIWHNIDSDSVPPQIASVRHILYFSTCHLLSLPSSDMVENSECSMTTVWMTTAVFCGQTFEHFTAKDST